MCDAEDDLRRSERTVAELDDKLGQMCRLIEDTERGIWTLIEAKRKAADIYDGTRVYA